MCLFVVGLIIVGFDFSGVDLLLCGIIVGLGFVGLKFCGVEFWWG